MNETQLDSVLQEFMKRWDIPGLGVGVVQGGEIAYAKGFGVQSMETQSPVTSETRFCVQSVSKCFVATAIMLLVERGNLNLDGAIVDYLPYFAMDDQRHRQITLRQALSHTSGMPDMAEIDYVELVTHPETDDGAGERYVRNLLDKKLIADPGERFSYSNIAYYVLGDLIAKTSGKSFEGFMREEVLIPSGMPSATFLPAEVPEKFLAVPYLRSPEMPVNPVYPYHRADAPASFLHTTVEDLCHWSITALNRGNYHGQSILSPESFDLMWQSVVNRGNQRPSLYEEMGLGWTLGHFKGLKTISHGGAGFGGTAFLLILPEESGAVAVLCNEESDAHFQVAQAVADMLTGQTARVGPISWMVPISQALAEGGIKKAYSCFVEIKDRLDEYYYYEGDLLNLALQLFTANQIDQAIDILGLNIHVFPEYIPSYVERAKYYMMISELTGAEKSLRQALSIDPVNVPIFSLLKELQSSSRQNSSRAGQNN